MTIYKAHIIYDPIMYEELYLSSTNIFYDGKEYSFKIYLMNFQDYYYFNMELPKPPVEEKLTYNKIEIDDFYFEDINVPIDFIKEIFKDYEIKLI